MDKEEIRQIAYDLTNADFDWRIARDKDGTEPLVQLTSEYAYYLATYIVVSIEQRKNINRMVPRNKRSGTREAEYVGMKKPKKKTKKQVAERRKELINILHRDLLELKAIQEQMNRIICELL